MPWHCPKGPEPAAQKGRCRPPEKAPKMQSTGRPVADSGAKVEAYNCEVSGGTVTCWVRAFVGGRMVNNASLKAVVRDGKIVSQSPN